MRLGLFLFFILTTSIVHSQGEMSTLFVGERFNLYNGAVHQQLWSVPDFIIANRDSFNVSIDDIGKINEAKIKLLPSVYLLHEENFWSVEILKGIDLTGNDKTIMQLSSTEEFYAFLLKNKANPKFEFYRDAEFKEPLFADEIDAGAKNVPVGLLLRESWSYNKITNELESFILGIGVQAKNSAGLIQQIWVYFPKIKGQLKYEYPNAILLEKLSNKKYSISSLEVRKKQFYAELDTVYCALDQLIIIEQLRQFLSYKSLAQEGNGSKNKEIKSLPLWNGLVYEGKFNNGFIDGKHQIKRGQTLLLEFHIVNQKLSGSLIKFDKGRVVEKFTFKDGLRSDTAKIFYPNGKLFQKLYFSDGYYQGEQEVFYPNGNLMIKYSFRDKVLDGLFTYNYPDGKIMYTGYISNGLKVGRWEYHVRVSPFLQTVINGNSEFFDRNFKSSSGWNASKLMGSALLINAEYDYYVAEDCLNHKCLNLIYR